MQKEWQRKQFENFSHHNWQHLNATPRTAREAFGDELHLQQSKAHTGDIAVVIGCLIAVIALAIAAF